MAFKTSEDNPIEAALQARLEAIGEEIDRLTRLAASAKDSAAQRQYWELAGDAQAEARKLREEFSRIAPSAKKRSRWRSVAGWLKACGPHRDNMGLIIRREC
jgi:hypothetical protein